MKVLRTGLIKYDDKHDSYFIQSNDGKVHTLHVYPETLFETRLGELVQFTSNRVNEVQSLELEIL